MSRAGFTLLEALVALLVLTGGLLAVLSVGSRAAQLVQRGRRATALAALATTRLETFQALPCGSVAGGTARVGDFELTWSTAVGSAAELDLSVRDLRHRAVTHRFVTGRPCP